MDEITVRAYGKVNLALDVTGKRDDGYHLVRMIMQTVDVYDLITIRKIGGPEDAAATCGSQNTAITADEPITIFCSHADVPADRSNLAYRAAALIRERYCPQARVHIHIDKQIPVAAGMAGGSADAAAVLTGMNRLFDLRIGQQEMDDMAVRLGADVPFCLRQGTYLSEGIGEILTRTADLPHCWMVIVKPDFSISTPWAYKTLDAFMEDDGRKEQIRRPDIDKLMEGLRSGRLDDIAAYMENVLEPVAVASHPEIREIKDRLYDYGAVRALMSGSGPTVFGIFAEKEAADRAFQSLRGGKYGRFEVEF